MADAMAHHQEMCRRAADDGFRLLSANPARAALVYRPGEIRLVAADQSTPSGFTLVQGSSQVPWVAMTCEQMSARIHDLTRSLPVLGPENDPSNQCAGLC